MLDLLEWPPERHPDLVTGYALIWLSLLGFMLTFRWLFQMAYEAPNWLAHGAALAAGVLVLGGGGRLWDEYPYDIPHLFIFSLTLAAILGSRWWMLSAFTVACYSKGKRPSC